HDLLALDPLDRDAGPGAAVTVELAALDRYALLGAARIAADLLQLHPEDVLQDALVEIARRAGAGRAIVHLRPRLQLVERLDAEPMPDGGARQVLADAADPIEFTEIDPDLVGR